MDLRQIKNIIKEFEESSIDMMEISEADFRIKLEKNRVSQTYNTSPSLTPAPAVTLPVAASPAREETPEEPETVPVKAPLVGTYYQSPSPDASPFVRLNQRVNKGDVLFIVEAMKVMNEVTAPVSGVVVNIHATDATMVEYGQVVMELKE
jgi:acetyl-CoA carboxylase biotin carboxyl carrier protein